MDLTGVQLDKYHVVERLDTGGMAVVYKAYQPDLDRYVALKVIAPELGHDAAFLRQFEREARTLARLEHPNILPIYDSGSHGDTPYLVTRYVQAGTLAEYLGRPLPLEEALRIVCQVGDALGYAHALGIVHRDVKPSNVLLDKSGRVLLADFGIAQEATADAGAGGGTPIYMAPEQRAGGPVDSRADIHALGVLLYELLTGKRAGEQTLLTRSWSATRIPSPLTQIIVCATASNPDDRYQVTEDFVAEVQEALLKIKGEFVQPHTTLQQTLEIIAIATFVLAGLAMGISAMTSQAGLYTQTPALVSAVFFLLNGVLLMLRDRTRPISKALLAAIFLVMLASVLIGFPVFLALDPFLSSFGSEIALLGLMPGSVLLLLAAGLYMYDRLKPRATVRRSVQAISPEAEARRARLKSRQARNALLQLLIGAFLTLTVARLVAFIAPANSTLALLARTIQTETVVAGAFMTTIFIVWYTLRQIASVSDIHSGQMPSQMLSNAESRRLRLAKAREYQARIQEAIAQTREGPLHQRLQAATRRLDEWVAFIERLTTRLNQLERDPVLRRDRSTVPRAVHMLEARLTQEQDSDTRVRDAVHQTLAARQMQLRSLRALERVMTQAELYSEETVAALGTVYSQVLLVDAQDVQGLRAQRLQADIDEQVQTLHDLLETMDEAQTERQDVAE